MLTAVNETKVDAIQMGFNQFSSLRVFYFMGIVRPGYFHGSFGEYLANKLTIKAILEGSSWE